MHRRPGGAVCITPVGSQHRGRLFLPFADDDPKTAEVVAKVLLLARDHEIKDPAILEQFLPGGATPGPPMSELRGDSSVAAGSVSPVQVLPRRTSSVGRITADGSSPEIAASSSRTISLLIRCHGCLIVVSAGRAASAADESSNPPIATSSGTRRPARRSAFSAPRAIASDATSAR